MDELKSRQFHRHRSIEPISKAASAHTHDVRPSQPRAANLTAHQLSENHYNLANVVQQILSIKPSTAYPYPQHRKEQRKSSRAQTLGDHCMLPEKITNNQTKPKNLLQLIRQQMGTRPNQEAQGGRRGTEEEEKGPSASSRSKNSWQSATHIKYETISHSKQSPSKPILKIPKPQAKPAVQHQLKTTYFPKTKLTVHNLDCRLSQQSQRLSLDRGSSHKLPPKRKAEDEPDSQQSVDNYMLQILEKKTGKRQGQQKVPDFIKASLQTYQQQPDYSIDALTLNQKPTAALKPIEPQQQEQPASADTHSQEDNLEGTKLRLLSKGKHRTTRIGDYIRSKHQQPPPVGSIGSTSNKQKVKRKKKGKEEEEELCGWEQFDLLTVQTLQ